MRRPLRSLVSLLAGSTLLVSAAACGSDSGSGDDGKVNVGAISIVDVAPLYLAEQQGFFDEQDLDVEITPTTGGAASVPGVVSGQFDFAFGNITSLLIARDKGLELKAVANGIASTGKPGEDFSAVLVQKDSPIKSAKDLAGRTVAVNNLNNIGDTTVREVVRKDGGDPSAIEFTEVEMPDMPAALDNGRVEAIWTVEPFVTQSRDLGARPVAWNFAEAVPDLTVSVYFTTAKRVSENPEQVERFATAINQGLAYARENPKQAREILKTYTKVPPEVIPEITLPAWPEEINRQSVQTIADLALRDGLLKNEADVDALLP